MYMIYIYILYKYIHYTHIQYTCPYHQAMTPLTPISIFESLSNTNKILNCVTSLV